MKDEFEELLEIEQVQIDSKRIKKKMNIYIYKKIGIVFLIFSLIIAGLLFINISKCKNEKKQYFNPMTFQIEDLDNRTSTQLLLSSFYNTQYPVEIIQNDLKKIAEDQYQFQVQEMSDLFHIYSGNDEEMTTIEINKDQINFQHKFSRISAEYKLPGKLNESYDFKLKKELKSLKELPQSSYLEMALSFDQHLTIKEFIALTQKYPHVNYLWACTYIDNWQNAYGINLRYSVIPELNSKILKKYPYIIEFDYQNEEQLKKHYQSSLKLLNDYPKFSNILFQDKEVTDAKKQYDQIKKGISFIGVKVYIKKDDLIKGIENGDMKYGMIEDIRYSKYEK